MQTSKIPEITPFLRLFSFFISHLYTKVLITSIPNPHNLQSFLCKQLLYFHSYLFPLSSNLSLQLLYIYCPKSAFTHFRPQKSLLNHSVVFYTKKMSFLKSIDFHTFYLQLSSTETLTEFPFSLFHNQTKKIYFM